ncbi:GtrA family protein [Hymenobacter roseosalivarius DSM 11622]|uniref:GtrA family protein n=1 Tax=Hymenobacter roseosalivarius DSM 11622 TaxID=645990 RepID=A0A1W1UMN5_9BACT|nr:GtrA family protein [Hymenobacter roseosalivarius]SMB82398.1 GtrA family protein [Hymenobacter roseosalivarius DSM 11622]
MPPEYAQLLMKLVKYGVVGGFGVAVDFSLTYLAKEKLRLNPYVANAIGFSVATCINFFLNRIWTFRSHDPAILGQFGYFALAAIIGLGLNTLLLRWLYQRWKVPFYVAKLISTGVVVIWNFVINAFYTFA